MTQFAGGCEGGSTFDDALGALRGLILGLSGGSILAASVVLALGYVAWDKYKDAAGESLKTWLATPQNFCAATVLLIGGSVLLQYRFYWTLGALCGIVTAFLIVSWKRQQRLARRLAVAPFPVRKMVGIGVLFLGATFSYDDHVRERRIGSSNVAFLLPPEGPKEPDKVFVRLRKTLTAVLGGVNQVRIVPDNLSSTQIAQYRIDLPRNLADFTSDGLRPRVFIESKFVRYSETAPDAEFKVVINPFQWHEGKERMMRVSDWQLEPLSTTQVGLPGAAMRGNFELLAFLSRKNILALNQNMEQTIWNNTLAEYRQFISETAPNCKVKEKLDQRIRLGGLLQVDEVRSLLSEPCDELKGTNDGQVAYERDRIVGQTRYQVFF